LTPDRNALIELLAEIGPGLIEPASSNTGAGIGAALGAFEVVGDRPRVIVLASDGEDSRRSGDLGAAEAARRNTRVVALALGTEAGSHIPQAGGFLRDREDRPVVTRRNTWALERLTATTDGRLFLGDEWGQFDFDLAAAAMRRESAGGGESIERRVPATRVVPFAGLAFAILLVEGLPRGGRRRRTIMAGLVWAMALWVVGGPPTAGQARDEVPSTTPSAARIQALERTVRDSPEDARARIDLGIAYFRIGSGADAAREFLAASLHARDAEVAATAHFDLGVVALGENDLPRASDAFFDALVLNPEDETARFNLEWALELQRKEGEAGEEA
jgi:Ca-activated chloride channel family protein